MVHGADPKGPGALKRGPALNNPALLDDVQGKYPKAGPLVKRAKMKRRLEQIEESMDQYLSQFDRAHRVESSVAEAKAVRLEDKNAA